MVFGSHLIVTAYGFWLANDPRGSWSDFVGAWELVRFGRATRVHTRRSLADRPHDRRLRLAAKGAMKYPPVRFSGRQARAVGRGFGEYTRTSGLTVWACSILPEHAHLVVGRHRLDARQVAIQLKAAGTRRLTHKGLHPLADRRRASGRPPTPWARGGWVVFLDRPADVERAIRYVEENPVREGLPRQRWSFVSPHAG